MTTAAYAKREIRSTISFGQGSYGSSGSDSLVIQGLRTTAIIPYVVDGSPQCTVRIFGLTLNQINQLSNAGVFWQARQGNTLKVEAGDENSSLTEIFNGDIFEASPDFSNQPDVSFVIICVAGRVLQQKPVNPITIKGSATAQQVFQQITQQAGLKLQMDGTINGTESQPYYGQTAWSQIQAAAETFNCSWDYDPRTNTVHVWPKGTIRNSSNTNLISAATGMIGYPEFQKMLVKVKTIFLPTIEIGGKFQIQSQLIAANGSFSAIAVSHDLAAHFPDGPWETDITGVPINGG